MLHRIVSSAFIVLIFFISAASAQGADPMQALQGPIEQIIAILKDPQYSSPEQKKLQHDLIWEHVRVVFDFKVMSRLTLGREWKNFTTAEQTEFSEVFSEFLGNTYIKKMQGEFTNEKVVFLSQVMLTEKKAEVKSKIIRPTVEVPADYRMRRFKDTWRVYDVIIEGISLIKNYRSQFSKILLKNSPAQLIEQLKDKLAQQKKDREGA